MDLVKDMECLARLEVGSCVYQLVKISLLLKLPKSMLSFTLSFLFCFSSLCYWFKERSFGSGATSGLTSSLACTPVQVWYLERGSYMGKGRPLNSLPASDLLLAAPVSVDDVALAIVNAVKDDDIFGLFTVEKIKEAAANVRA
ncbi:hypothetical protein POM88_037159 [Heracleum sosnowskyi]|uniref:Uncharacterized protein n=1 Tax=Heracleum sosnowskyi TaxID=360622 RepID=A0AAD8HRJ7_9APIA|nr:hypothetical protein POM88_037159 [Heracleum sosnowskyi]